MTVCAGVWVCISSRVSVPMLMRFILCAHKSHMFFFLHPQHLSISTTPPPLQPQQSQWKRSTIRHLWALWFAPRMRSRRAARFLALWPISRCPQCQTPSPACDPSPYLSSPKRMSAARERSSWWSRRKQRAVLHHFINTSHFGRVGDKNDWYESFCQEENNGDFWVVLCQSHYSNLHTAIRIMTLKMANN